MNHVSRAHSVITIFRKDLQLFTRDFLFIFMTVLSVVTFVTLYWVLPRNVDETISLGIRGEGLEQTFTLLAGEQEEGMALSWFDTGESLRTAVEEKEVEIGIDFPDGFVSDIAKGSQVQVTVYVRPNLPVEVTGAMSTMVKEIAYAVAGYQLPIIEPSEQTVVLGIDRAGEQTLGLLLGRHTLADRIVLPFTDQCFRGRLPAADQSQTGRDGQHAHDSSFPHVFTSGLALISPLSDSIIIRIPVVGFNPIDFVVLLVDFQQDAPMADAGDQAAEFVA